MRKLGLITLIAQLFLQYGSCQQDDYYFVGYKLYLLNNGTYTMVDILAQSNSSKFWGALNQVQFIGAEEFINNQTTQKNSTVSNNATTQLSTCVIMGNETVDPFYYEQGDKFNFNHSTLSLYNSSDMLIISIPDKLRVKEVVIETLEFKEDHALTIFLDEYSTNFVKNYTESAQSRNESVQTFFMQITYLNCQKLSPFIRLVTTYEYIYFFFEGHPWDRRNNVVCADNSSREYDLLQVIILNLMMPLLKNGDLDIYLFFALGYVINAFIHKTRLQRFQYFVSQLAFLKVIFCLFTLAVWKRCPWSNNQQENQQSDNFLKSFKITLQTLYQTMFCGLMFSMAMGLKITKQKLKREEFKKVIIVAAMQYIVDSIYSISYYLPDFQPYSASMINVFSLVMIVLLLIEAKGNFDQINLRLFLMNQNRTPGLNSLKHTLSIRKRLISMITLTSVLYFVGELFFHGVWDLYLSKTHQHFKYNLVILAVHEAVDMLTVIMILCIVKLSASSQIEIGDAFIDLSNQQFNPDALMIAAKAEFYQATIRDKEVIDSDVEGMEEGDIVLVVGPDQEDGIDSTLSLGVKTCEEVNNQTTVGETTYESEPLNK